MIGVTAVLRSNCVVLITVALLIETAVRELAAFFDVAPVGLLTGKGFLLFWEGLRR
jgi:hypothetical protein